MKIQGEILVYRSRTEERPELHCCIENEVNCTFLLIEADLTLSVMRVNRIKPYILGVCIRSNLTINVFIKIMML